VVSTSAAQRADKGRTVPRRRGIDENDAVPLGLQPRRKIYAR
jgi:hypothetical protein